MLKDNTNDKGDYIVLKTDENDEKKENKNQSLNKETKKIKKEDESLETKYLKTNVQGFDELITKGIPEGSQILISGGPGTLKTTFCMQLLANSAKEGKKCLFLSFEEPKKNLIRNMKEYGVDLIPLLESKNLVIENLDPFRMSRSVETLLAQARGELLIEVNEVKNLIPGDLKPDLIVVDSLSAISAGFFGKDEGYRAYMSQIFETFRKMGVTSFLITEIEHNTNKYSQSGVEEFLADGVFVFYNLPQGNQKINATEVVKLRGTQHKKKIVPFKPVANKGIVVYPLEELFVNKE